MYETIEDVTSVRYQDNGNLVIEADSLASPKVIKTTGEGLTIYFKDNGKIMCHKKGNHLKSTVFTVSTQARFHKLRFGVLQSTMQAKLQITNFAGGGEETIRDGYNKGNRTFYTGAGNEDAVGDIRKMYLLTEVTDPSDENLNIITIKKEDN